MKQDTVFTRVAHAAPILVLIVACLFGALTELSSMSAREHTNTQTTILFTPTDTWNLIKEGSNLN